MTAGNKGTAVFKEFALKLASLYIYRTAMRKVIDLPWQTDYVSFFLLLKIYVGQSCINRFIFCFRSATMFVFFYISTQKKKLVEVKLQ